MTADHIARFQRHMNDKQFGAAFDVCTDAICANATDWNALYLAGVTFRFRGDSAAAIGYYEKALQHTQDVAEIWLALGIALQSLQRFPDAIRALHTAVRLAPINYPAHNSLGLTYKLAGDHPSAMHAYEDALQVCADRAFQSIRRDHPEFFRFEQRGNERVMIVDRAYMQEMRQILETDFDYFNTVKNMVTCCREMGDHQKAARLQDHADNCTPIDADIIGPIQLRNHENIHA